MTSVTLLDDGTDAHTVLQYAAAVEAVSEHPIARAIVQAALAYSVDLRPVTAFRARPGEGVEGVVDGVHVVVRRDETASCEVRLDDVPVASLEISDVPREDAADAVRQLDRLGVDVHMLSGDRRLAAQALGDRLGLAADRVHAEATPETKQSTVRDLGPGVVMVGDGINDAAALAEADLGIAMASGTNIAIESADVVIPGDSVQAVPWTIWMSRRTLRTIRENLFFAFCYNVVMIPVAALGLLGASGPVLAAVAMGLSDITVVGNALRLRYGLERSDEGESGFERDDRGSADVSEGESTSGARPGIASHTGP